MLLFEPVGERGEDQPGPGLSHPNRVGMGECLTKLVVFVVDCARDGVKRANEGQGFDRPRLTRLGLD